MSDPKATYTYFDNGSPVGQVRVDRGIWRSLQALPSWAFFCPHCGEIWGRAVRVSPEGSMHWIVMQRPCTAHGDGQMLIGQNLDECDSAILNREVFALLERYKDV